MGLGILEDNHLGHVPGTAPLADAASDVENSRISDMRHSTGRDRDIILVPQPSDSPRDPLNWPLWKRDCIFLLLTSATAMVDAWAYMLTPAYGLLSEEFKVVCPIY